MTVYVDNARRPGPWYATTAYWSHLTADTKDELHIFAERLGLRRDWFCDEPSGPGTTKSPPPSAGTPSTPAPARSPPRNCTRSTPAAAAHAAGPKPKPPSRKTPAWNSTPTPAW